MTAPLRAENLLYIGDWNAATNTPTLLSGVGTIGQVYIVNVAGSTDLGGITDWAAGDWAVYTINGWQHISGAVGALLAANNLADLTNPSQARLNLGFPAPTGNPLTFLNGSLLFSVPGGSSSTFSRETIILTSSVLANNAVDSAHTIPIGKFGFIYSVSSSVAACVRFYSTAVARAADLTRPVGLPPIPIGAGCIAEFVSTSAQLGPFSNPLASVNLDSSPDANIYLTIINLSGSTQAVTVTVVALPSIES